MMDVMVFSPPAKRYKRYLIVTILVSSILVLILSSTSIYFGYKIKTDKLCTTSACIKAANNILENMDLTADPCENFHQFTCGSFVKNKRIPDEQGKIDVFDILRTELMYSVAELLDEKIDDKEIDATKNAKRLYKSCVDEDLINKNAESEFLSVLEADFGGWPILKPAATLYSSQRPILDKIIQMRRIGFRSMIDMFVTLNPKDPELLILKIKQPGWLFNKHYYSDASFMEAYKDYMRKYIGFLNPSLNNLDKDIDMMIKLETDIAMKLTNEDLKRNSTFRNMTVRELAQEIPKFDWVKFLIGGVLKDVEGLTVNDSEPLIVEDLEYLHYFADLYYQVEVLKNHSTFTIRDMDNLMIWSAFKNEVNFLPKKYRDVKLDFDKIYKGTKSSHARQVVCASFVIDYMEFAVGRLYVANFFDNKSKKASIEMIENIRTEFRQILRETEWMDEESRKKAIEKADNIDNKIGYPDYLYNDTYLNEMYEDFHMNESEHLNNSLKLIKIESINGFIELRTKRDPKQWISGPAVVNAYYSPYANQICFPAGILQAPFYDSGFPKYLNYGGIGSVIGHEITHGFDDRGRLYDKNGVYFADGASGLWTNKTVERYKEKAKCIIDQYSSYHVKQINRTLNGILTQGENIADNGGLKESFRAYKKWVKKNGAEPLLPGLNFNQYQLFFINYAQVWCTKYREQSLMYRILNSNHSPGEFRIIGPTSNSDDFARVFNCKPGQKNNPENKCSVW